LKISKKQLLITYFPSVKKSVPGWGSKRSSARARFLAKATFRRPVFLEDGFLRSYGRDDTPISLVLDTQGIYYDARKASDLEEMIVAPKNKEEKERASRVIDLWRASSASKYNHLPEPLELPQKPYVLVMDQVCGDKSIKAGLANQRSFSRMLDEALVQHPNSTIAVKVHPDVSTGRKSGHYDLEKLSRMDRVEILDDSVHPVQLIIGAEAIYTVSSQTGFEGLIHGVPVTTFGMPFYAGWGLTRDMADTLDHRVGDAMTRRSRGADLESLVHGALIQYPSYVNPETLEAIPPELAIDLVARHRRRFEARTGTIHAVGFSLWKRPILRKFLLPAEVVFRETMKGIPEDSTVALWGAHGVEHMPPGCKVIRIEDGFIRSKGLGVELVAPSSWVLDDLGIYFDSRRPSRLEYILQTHEFSAQRMQEARALRKTIVKTGVTKYNLPGKGWVRPDAQTHVILITGQVESDASIRFGSPKLKTNLELVKAVRVGHPEAYLIYKPHPDVAKGYRSKGGTEAKIPQFCDEVVDGGDILDLFAKVDEVHTMTSLAGFEALIRGIPVTCYGQPFYSGWGLTKDVVPCERRIRRRSIDELISAALVEYPDYMSREGDRTISAATAIQEILSQKPRLSRVIPFRRTFVKWVALRAEKRREATRK